MSTTISAPPSDVKPKRGFGSILQTLARPPIGSLIVLIAFCVIFSIVTNTFLAPSNLSLVVQQSVIVGTLAIGETLVILTAGIDLANGSIAVLGTIIAGRLVNDGYDALGCLVLAIVVCTLVGVVSGTLVSRLKLPPFIVTLGLLGIVTAATRLISQGGAFPVTDDLLSWTGNVFTLGTTPVTYGMVIMLGLYALIWYILTQTAWGRQVYAIGNSPSAARLVGIPVGRRILSVYTFAALLYGLGAWLALGRIPNADPNALQTANLDSITAVVIGGTSLFGGRGNIWGTLIGTLIVGVLRNGLTLVGIDPLWQDLVTGVLVIAAVALDQLSRWRRM
ncbi:MULTISPECIES: ABC transporter permease [unclassified Acidisoma]|jgi:fructose transport system permease protein|uniref:ABC transporter permease n=1 Tax=unclassified Acidisoma TaxID=2634065 RepID=UPI00131AAF02|nr:MULTISPECIES: ABC transporter permease [unclassified Acidisoma]